MSDDTEQEDTPQRERRQEGRRQRAASPRRPHRSPPQPPWQEPALPHIQYIAIPSDLERYAHVHVSGQAPLGQRLLAVLLYTEEDSAVATYVRDHYMALDELSGPHCTLLVLQAPPRHITDAARGYMLDTLNAYWSRIWQSTPDIQSQTHIEWATYAIARQWQVVFYDLPCLLFLCVNREQYVLPIRGNLTVFFRTLFGTIEQELANPNLASDREMLQAVQQKIASLREHPNDEHITPDTQSLLDLLAIHRRRLTLLEQQRAAYGLAVDPHIVMEIEDIRATIATIEAELGNQAPG